MYQSAGHVDRIHQHGERKLTPENREFVLRNLRAIHVPGEVVGDSVYVYGHRMDVDYI